MFNLAVLVIMYKLNIAKSMSVRHVVCRRLYLSTFLKPINKEITPPLYEKFSITASSAVECCSADR